MPFVAAQPAHAAGHLQLDVAFQAVNHALVGDVVLRLLAPGRQHQVQQLQPVGLQQAGADGVVQTRPERTDVDDVQRLL